MRSVNKSLLLELVRARGRTTRAELARETGFTRATVSQIIADLVAEGWLEEVGIGDSPTGRKPVLYEYRPRLGVVLGLDLGGSTLQCAVANLSGQIVSRRNEPTGGVRTSHELLDRIERLARETLAAAPAHPAQGGPELRAVGVATPGIVDVDLGVVLGASPNLPEWHDLPLREHLERRLGVPVRVENDVNAALLGEHRFGRARGVRNAAFVAVSTGLGGALLLDGRLYRGARGGAGEIGYWLAGHEHVHADWGGRGCLESLCSGSAMARAAGAPDARAVCELARAGDAAALEIVQSTAEYLGLAVSNLASLLDLEMVVLGGGVMLSADLFLDLIRSIVARHAPTRVEVVPSQLGDEAGLRGAVQMALTAVTPDVRLEVG